MSVALLQRWWPNKPVKHVLKTDLFDEVFSDGLYPALQVRAKHIFGIDISNSIVSAATRKYPQIHALVADVRQLPFKDHCFDLIVSNSTLDHFHTVDEIDQALAELLRVLRPGGQMLVTLDNLRNPKIALRQVLPFGILKQLGVVPYFVGKTLGPRRLIRFASQAGAHVVDVETTMHCPRILAVAAANALQDRASLATQECFSRALMVFEHFSRWPTHSFTGHFVAVRVIK